MKKPILFTLLFFALSYTFANILYVSEHARGLNNGSSWEHAFNSLQDAISAASNTSIDSIWVTAGTYKPDRPINGLPEQGSLKDWVFHIDKSVKIFGGFSGNETHLSQRNWQTNPSILDGDLGTKGFSGDNAKSVIFIENCSYNLLDGFTIQYAHGSSDGGGLVVQHVEEVSLQNLTIQNCWTAGSGGGLYASNIQAGEITNVVCANNTADIKGGGFYLQRLGRLTLKLLSSLRNTAESGGGIYADSLTNMTLDGMYICGNTAIDHGGGLYASHFSKVDLMNVSLSENLSGKNGGAGLLSGFSEVNFANITCINNTAIESYGGLGLSHSSTLHLYNSIFWDNTDEHGNLQSYSQISQDNGLDDMEVSFTIIQGSNGSGSRWHTNLVDMGNNLDIDPGFENTYGVDTLPCTRDDDYTPSINSPVIDAGSMDIACIGVYDANGNPRITGGQVDMGACESQISFAVDWLSFEGKYEQGHVFLDWSTASERGADFFVVERLSEDQPNWKPITKVKANGHTDKAMAYRFIDTDVAGDQKLRYRIKEVDLNGSENFSPQIALQSVSEFSSQVRLFPNPARDVLHVSFKGWNPQEELEMSISNAQGQKVSQFTGYIPSDRLLKLELNTLSSGMYVLELRQGVIRRKTRFIKL